MHLSLKSGAFSPHVKSQLAPEQARSACVSVFRFCQNTMLKCCTNICTDSGANCSLVASVSKERHGKQSDSVDLLNKSMECSVVLSDSCISSRC